MFHPFVIVASPSIMMGLAVSFPTLLRAGSVCRKKKYFEKIGGIGNLGPPKASNSENPKNTHIRIGPYSLIAITSEKTIVTVGAHLVLIWVGCVT